MPRLYDAVIYVYESSYEAHREKWKWLSLDGEIPSRLDRQVITHFYYTLQRTPAFGKLIYNLGNREQVVENNSNGFRYFDCDQRDSDALEHLEKIANSMADENGALLYLNHENDEIAVIAESIVKYGRSSVMWEYSVCAEKYVA
jgi:hypothetical protein